LHRLDSWRRSSSRQKRCNEHGHSGPPQPPRGPRGQSTTLSADFSISSIWAALAQSSLSSMTDSTDLLTLGNCLLLRMHSRGQSGHRFRKNK
jgi:hypothetical protein